MYALIYLCVSVNLMAILKHRPQHNLAQFSSISYILTWISRFLTTCAVSFTTLDTA